MGQQDEYKLTKRRTTDELEHDDSSSPATKKTLAYGWDSTASAKVKLAVDANGKVKVA